ncbi:hypothetical protein C6W23_20655 [Bacillus atrophaeus]|nr:hypothetical protein C6W23_20655 [Bacillus atrophaeus]
MKEKNLFALGDFFHGWNMARQKPALRSPERSKHHKFYSAELKQAAVKDFLSGSYSQREITRNYQIPTDLLFQNKTFCNDTSPG